MKWIFVVLFIRGIQAYDPCDPNPCQNSGVCVDLGCDFDEIITSTYTSFGSGMCTDLVPLPEGEYPPLLSNTSELYNSDRNQECMQRCLDTCSNYVMFTVRKSDDRCSCSPLCDWFAGDLVNPQDYDTYNIVTPDVTEFFCECTEGFGGQTCSNPVPVAETQWTVFWELLDYSSNTNDLEVAQYNGVPAVQTTPFWCIQTKNYPNAYSSYADSTARNVYAINSLGVLSFDTEDQASSCMYDGLKIGSTWYCDDEAALQSGLSVAAGTDFKFESDVSDNGNGFRICVFNGVPANGVACVASSDSSLTTPDEDGNFFCVDGDISGDTTSGCVCSPKACVIQNPMSESWHKNCASANSLISGTDGNCKCNCNKGSWDGFQWKGGRCVSDVNECTNLPTGPATFRATARCSPNADCLNAAGSYSCTCQEDWVDAINGDFVDIDQTECLLQSTIDAVKLIIPPARPYGTASEISGSFSFVGAGCVFYYDTSTRSLSRVIYNTATLTSDIGKESYSICKCADCDQTYHLVTDKFGSCADYTPIQGHACVPESCVVEASPTEPNHIACANGNATGRAGNCGCECPVDSSGADQWLGALCDTDVNECINSAAGFAVDNCGALAACANTDGGFNCTCNAGYAGDGITCTDVNECEGENICLTTQFCFNIPGDYICLCNGGFITVGDTIPPTCKCVAGKNLTETTCIACEYPRANHEENSQCELQVCNVNEQVVDAGTFDKLLDPSSSNANCEDCIAGFASPGGANPTCEDIDECSPDPCLNGATCSQTSDGTTPVVGGYFCACPVGFSGVNCEVNVDDCVGTPCKNSGTCIDGANTFSCNCSTSTANSAGVSGWTGATCEDNVDECTIGTDNCDTNAVCGDTDGDFTCVCSTNYNGDGTSCTVKDCEIGATADAWTIACVNGAATGTAGNCICGCDTGWEGALCDQDINECLEITDDCLAYHTCLNNQGSYSCLCKSLFETTAVANENPICICPAGADLSSPSNESTICSACEAGKTNSLQNSQCSFAECSTDSFVISSGFDFALVSNDAANCEACATGYFSNDPFSTDCEASDCTTSNDPSKQGSDGEMYCLYGDATGVTSACGCECVSGFSGINCDECAAGSGFNGSACVPCANTQANNLTTHGSVCADQSCSAGFGVVTDGFNFNFDPADTSTTNCVVCTGIQASPAGNGVCITQTCGENEQVVSVGFDPILDPTSSNANCEACAAGFASTAGPNPICEDINECSPDPCQNEATCSTPNLNSYECACVAGYNGTNCETDINECIPDPCQNGALCTDGTNNHSCACVAGYEGTNCETDINECSPDPCQNGAACSQTTDGTTLTVNAYYCACVAGYEGTNCGTNINECSPDPCQNGAVCVDGINNHSCACVAGYNGTNCETDINDCSPDPCQNGGTCTDGIDTYSCACVTGYEGTNCETDINDCSPDPCENGATCIDGINSYSCACVAGYNGTNCEGNINECSPDPCENGASCADGINSYSCACVAGYEGTNCETDINDCIPDPCVNGALCTDGIDSYSCGCANGFSGLNCDECAAGKGFNGSACVPCANKQANNLTTHDAVCANQICSAGFGVVTDGFNFNLNPFDTSTTNCVVCTGIQASPAGNGVCITQTCGENEQVVSVGFDPNLDPTSSNANCELCDAGFASTAGPNPICEDINECSPDPCQNGATCSTPFVNLYSCACVAGYEGTNCETDINECSPDPCQNSAVCTTPLVNSYSCACLPGYEGATCGVDINECSPDPCQNGAGCINEINSYTCTCPENNMGNVSWSGPTCDIDIDECAQGTHNCGSFHTCNNTDGDFSCECNAGFESTPGSPPTCHCPAGFENTSSTCTACVYPTTNHLQNSQCTHAECQSDQFIHSIEFFTSILPHNHLSNCQGCPLGTFSNNALSLTCEDFNECAVGIAGTCGVFNDNGTQVPMGTCVESSTDGTVALGAFECNPAAGFDCSTLPCTDIKECDTTPCGLNSVACTDTYTAVDPTGFQCTCALGYSGLLCDVPELCSATLDDSDLGLDGNFYCRYGTISGTTGSCSCDCISGFSGDHCDVCTFGSGFLNEECIVCTYPATNDQRTHDAPCIIQQCNSNRGVVVDGLAFNASLDGNFDNTNCIPCPPGTQSPHGSGICGNILCGVNEKVENNLCVPCEEGSTSLSGSDASGSNTQCIGIPCSENLRVINSQCLPCPAGTTNEAGDLRNQGDTFCDAVPCLENEKVHNNQCEQCPPGSMNEGGDNPAGPNTECDSILCETDEYVLNHVCTACENLYVNLEGDDSSKVNTVCVLGCIENQYVSNHVCLDCNSLSLAPALANPQGEDTECIFEGSCGNEQIGYVSCNEENTFLCANDLCACKIGFAGTTCDEPDIADASASTILKQNFVSQYKTTPFLPSDSLIVASQGNIAEHLSDIVTSFVQQGVLTSRSVAEHLVVLDEITVMQRVVTSQAPALMAVAPKLEDDDCLENGAFSVKCSTLDFNGLDQIVFLHAPPGFWSIITKSASIISKQTSINNTDFEMQCWNENGWDPKQVFYRDSLYECNGFVILIGSQSPICHATITQPNGVVVPGTCGLKGACSVDGLSYTCVCSPGYTGEFCEIPYVPPSSCSDVNCVNYGGVNSSVLSVPNNILESDLISFCCNYNTRADFDEICEAEVLAVEYVSRGCCARQFCI